MAGENVKLEDEMDPERHNLFSFIVCFCVQYFKEELMLTVLLPDVVIYLLGFVPAKAPYLCDGIDKDVFISFHHYYFLFSLNWLYEQ